MAKFTSTLRVSNQNQGETHWEPPKPALFNIGDEITFTSKLGPWEVHFQDSPFSLAPKVQIFTGTANEERSAKIARHGQFPCKCGLNVNGIAVPWIDGGDDIKTTPPPQSGNPQN